jgi:hypothetical protein
MMHDACTYSFYEVFSWQDDRLSFNVSGNGACVVSGIAPGVPSIDLDIDQITDGTTKVIWTPSVIISNVEHETIGIGIGFIMPDGSITTVRGPRVDSTLFFQKRKGDGWGGIQLFASIYEEHASN